jgi:hypothetical protein
MRTTNYQSGEVTELAVALDRAMASNASALVAYARIYGSSWSPLASYEGQAKSFAPTTTANTVR